MWNRSWLTSWPTTINEQQRQPASDRGLAEIPPCFGAVNGTPSNQLTAFQADCSELNLDQSSQFVRDSKGGSSFHQADVLECTNEAIRFHCSIGNDLGLYYG